MSPHPGSPRTLRQTRFRVAKPSWSRSTSTIPVKLYLPSWPITTFAVAIGPHKVHVSVYENGSDDVTPELLALFGQMLHSVGTSYTIVAQGRAVASDFSGHRRIPVLAQFRNRALLPLLDPKVAPAMAGFDHVVFLNDIVFCAADVLEVVLQRKQLNAVMTTALDFQFLKIPEFEASGYPLLF